MGRRTCVYYQGNLGSSGHINPNCRHLIHMVHTYIYLSIHLLENTLMFKHMCWYPQTDIQRGRPRQTVKHTACQIQFVSSKVNTIIVILSQSFLLSFRGIQSSKLDLLLITPALHEKPIFGPFGAFLSKYGQTRFIIKNQAPSFFGISSLCKKTKKFNEKMRKIQDKIQDKIAI